MSSNILTNATSWLSDAEQQRRAMKAQAIEQLTALLNEYGTESETGKKTISFEDYDSYPSVIDYDRLDEPQTETIISISLLANQQNILLYYGTDADEYIRIDKITLSDLLTIVSEMVEVCGRI